MTANSKLSITFSLMAALLLGAGTIAILLIGRSESPLAQTTHTNRNLSHLTQAIQSMRTHPDRVAENEAWINDLGKMWTDSPVEQKYLTEARRLLAQDRNAARAVEPLEQLQRRYITDATAAAQQLTALRKLAVLTTIAVIAGSVLLVVLLMFLTRVWLVHPLRDLHTACLQAGDGQHDVTLTTKLPAEVADAGAALQKIVTELRGAQQNAEHAKRLASVGEACSHVTNSLSQALHSISTVAQYEGNAEHVDPNAKAGFQYIIATVNKLEAWVRNLHTVVGPNRLQAAPQAIEPILRDVVSLLQPRLQDLAVQIALEPADSLPNVKLDRARFEQVLIAVLGNAIEASPAGGKVTVRTRNNNDQQAIIQIEDQGPGMTESTRNRAFDAFFTTKRENVGLGLTMAANVIAQHSGKIAIEPGPTGGTRVSIELPAA